MKAGSVNTRLFIGNFLNPQMNSTENKKKPFQFNMGNNQAGQDKVAQKRQDAREKAMKLMKDVFSADKQIDDDMAERAGRVAEAENAILDANSQIKALDQEKEKLKETYGITEDSEEQQDLKLLEKRRDSMKPDSEIKLTEDEKARLAEIDAKGMTDYQKASLEIDSFKGPYNKTIEESQKIIKQENAIIRETSLNRLKSAPMVGAAQQAGEIMESANKEIIGMIVEDGKNTVDEKMEEIKEEMEEAKEEKEEQDERIEEIQQRNEELEAAYQEQREEQKNKIEILDMPTEQILGLNEIKSDIKQEVNNMLTEMKLLAEDVKGSMVDTGV